MRKFVRILENSITQEIIEKILQYKNIDQEEIEGIIKKEKTIEKTIITIDILNTQIEGLEAAIIHLDEKYPEPSIFSKKTADRFIERQAIKIFANNIENKESSFRQDIKNNELIKKAKSEIIREIIKNYIDKN